MAVTKITEKRIEKNMRKVFLYFLSMKCRFLLFILFIIARNEKMSKKKIIKKNHELRIMNQGDLFVHNFSIQNSRFNFGRANRSPSDSEGGGWWAWQGSNLRPSDYESRALTTELQAPLEQETRNKKQETMTNAIRVTKTGKIFNCQGLHVCCHSREGLRLHSDCERQSNSGNPGSTRTTKLPGSRISSLQYGMTNT